MVFGVVLVLEWDLKCGGEVYKVIVMTGGGFYKGSVRLVRILGK